MLKNLGVIIALSRMRNNPLKLVDTISFLGDEPRSGWVRAHTVIAQSMIMYNGILPAIVRHPRKRNSATPALSIISVVKHLGVFGLVEPLDLAVDGVTNLFTRLVM